GELVGLADPGRRGGEVAVAAADALGEFDQRADGAATEEPAEPGGGDDRAHTHQCDLLLLVGGGILRLGERDRHRQEGRGVGTQRGGEGAERGPGDVDGVRSGIELGQPAGRARHDLLARPDRHRERPAVTEDVQERRCGTGIDDEHPRRGLEPPIELLQIVAGDREGQVHAYRGDDDRRAQCGGGGDACPQRLRSHVGSRNTKPTPRTVCTSRGVPSISNLRRR
ncbi:hypothetical protein IM877_10600, partial [Rhodococcus sp. GG48]|nr:hypothetical protein [Rhodococcus sp. GG48]